MKDNLIKELSKIEKKPYVNQQDFNEFQDFLSTSQHITRPQNPDKHICALFMPYHKQTKSIYLGHHIKVNDWIPPGGHIELGEDPVKTVIRESQEELQYEVSPRQITLFDLTIVDIDAPHYPCKKHYDLWYLIEMEDMNQFHFDTGEFYDAKWLAPQDALSLTKHPNYRTMTQHFLDNK